MPDGIGFKEGVKIEKEKWAKMNAKQRWSYFQTYYLKWVIAIILIIAALVSITVSVIKGKKTENLFEGALVNTYISTEGENYLGDGYLEHLGTGKYRKVYLNTAINISVDEDNLDQYMYANRVKLMSLMAAKELDYMIVSKEALHNLEAGDTYADLTTCLSEELMEELSDYIEYAQHDETMEEYPAAIRITDSYLVKEYQLSPKDCYLVFISNSKRLDRAEDFVTYIYWGE